MVASYAAAFFDDLGRSFVTSNVVKLFPGVASSR